MSSRFISQSWIALLAFQLLPLSPLAAKPEQDQTMEERMDEAISFFERPLILPNVAPVRMLESLLMQMRKVLFFYQTDCLHSNEKDLQKIERLEKAMQSFYETYFFEQGMGLVKALLPDSFIKNEYEVSNSIVTAANRLQFLEQARVQFLEQARRSLHGLVGNDLNLAINQLAEVIVTKTKDQGLIVERFEALAKFKGNAPNPLIWKSNVDSTVKSLAEHIQLSSMKKSDRIRLGQLAYTFPEIDLALKAHQIDTSQLPIVEGHPEIAKLIAFSRDPANASAETIREMSEIFLKWEQLAYQLPPSIRRSIFTALLDFKVGDFAAKDASIAQLQRALGIAVSIETKRINPNYPDSVTNREGLGFWDVAGIMLKPGEPAETLLTESDRLQVLPSARVDRPTIELQGRPVFEYDPPSPLQAAPPSSFLYRLMQLDVWYPIHAKAFLRMAPMPPTPGTKSEFNVSNIKFSYWMSAIGRSRELYLAILKDPIASTVYHTYNNALGFRSIGHTSRCKLLLIRFVERLKNLKPLHQEET